MVGSEVQVAVMERHRVIEGPTDGTGTLKATGTRTEYSLGKLMLKVGGSSGLGDRRLDARNVAGKEFIAGGVKADERILSSS